MSHLLIVAVLAVLAVLAHAQTFTSTDINGNTIVGVLTLNPLDIPTTSTLAGVTTTSPTTTLVVTTDPVIATTPTTTSTLPVTTDANQGEQGPVGQPTATTFSPGGPTPFTYTTIINGVTSVVLDTFIPTNPTTQLPTVTATGTIWDFSSWQAVFAPSSTAIPGANGVVGGPLISGSLVLGFVVGTVLVLY
ncbi:hypothetical protein E4T56_gene2289 [Termitomyces sp. T112]|nr:hypothetical protein E4T56_gene2289 [Termitomyces sp. T112]